MWSTQNKTLCKHISLKLRQDCFVLLECSRGERHSKELDSVTLSENHSNVERRKEKGVVNGLYGKSEGELDVLCLKW